MSSTEVQKMSYKDVALADTGGGGASLAPKSFGDVVAFSELMARSSVAIPKHLRDNAGACMAVTMQALRWEMDPFAVAKKTYLVNDQIAYEAQLVAAVVVTRAPIKRRPEYIYSGEGPSLRCKVSVEMLDGSTKEYESPPFAAIPVKNSPLWKSDPEQQLGYYSIRAWARRHAPEVILGVYSPDELDEERAAARLAPPAPNRLAEKLAAGPKGEGGFSPEHVQTELRSDIIEGEVISEKDAEAPKAPAVPDDEGEADPAGANPAFEAGAQAAREGASRKNPPAQFKKSEPELSFWMAGYDSVKGAA